MSRERCRLKENSDVALRKRRRKDRQDEKARRE